jgi:DNA-binding MarR family transcriptional regulator
LWRLTLSRPAIKGHPGLAFGNLREDASGHLYDAAMRRAAAETGGGASADILETLAALRFAAKQMHDSMERFADDHGLSESRLRVLTRLYYSPEHRLPLGVLADCLNVTPRTMTDIVDVLERDGLVKRVPDTADRRSVLAVITKAGLERLRLMRRNAIAKQAALAEGFTPDKLAQLRHLCLMLVRNLNRERQT